MFKPCEMYDNSGWYISVIPDEIAKVLKIKSSYQLVAARLLGFSYPDYLRYARSKGAKLQGRDGYSLVVFPEISKCEKFCNELNTEWKKVIRAVKEYTNGKDN